MFVLHPGACRDWSIPSAKFTHMTSIYGHTLPYITQRELFILQGAKALYSLWASLNSGKTHCSGKLRLPLDQILKAVFRAASLFPVIGLARRDPWRKTIGNLISYLPLLGIRFKSRVWPCNQVDIRRVIRDTGSLAWKLCASQQTLLWRLCLIQRAST